MYNDIRDINHADDTERQGSSLFGEKTRPALNHHLPMDETKQALREASYDIGQLTKVVNGLSKALASIEQRESEIVGGINRLNAFIEKVMLPMAIANRSYQERDSDRHVLAPAVSALALLLDRYETEKEGIDPSVLSFAFVEDCRSLDVAEILGVIQLFGVEQFTYLPGAKFDSSTASVQKVRFTQDKTRHGKISRTMRAGYRRTNDGWVIRPAFVEVFGPPRT